MNSKISSTTTTHQTSNSFSTATLEKLEDCNTPDYVDKSVAYGTMDKLSPNTYRRRESASNASITIYGCRKYIWTCLVLAGLSIFFWTMMQDRDINSNTNIPHSGGTENSPSQASAADGQVPATKKGIHIGTLDVALLPGSRGHSKHHSDHRRLIFIGDIHGCIKELMHLLERADYNKKRDHIVSLGDIVNKGPDSQAVIDFLRDQKASCVRGNHDDMILQEVAELRSADVGGSGWVEDPEHKLARSLTKHQIEYLQSCPIILRIGDIASGYMVAVHGGLVPTLDLEDQDEYDVMNMRIIDKTTHKPSKLHSLPGSVPWAELWNEYQHSHARADEKDHGKKSRHKTPTTVVYGHDAKKGLQLRKYSKGLDSGCVGGGQLTAFIVDEDGRQDIVQVKCKSYLD